MFHPHVQYTICSMIFFKCRHYLGIVQFLVGIVSSYRYTKEAVNIEDAKSEALRLREAINTKQLDHDHIVWILSIRNLFQLRATFACYRHLYGNTLEQV